MDRCAIFVDAGYVIAEGAKHYVSSAAKRGDVSVDYPALIGRTSERARAKCGLPLLRTYWYDGAVDGVPTTEQLAISSLPDVKLRLGRLSGGRQKGVDALVYRDLTVLARERSIVAAFLIAGDEDLREGVVAAQELGIHVTLWGVGQNGNQARTLCAEVDRVERLDDVGDLLTAAPGSQIAMADDCVIPGEAFDEDRVRATASAFARNWATKATADEVSDLLAARPWVPSALDAELLRAVQAVHGNLRGHAVVRRAVRDAFWTGVAAGVKSHSDAGAESH